MWYGVKQDMAHLQVFGTIAYTHILLDFHLSKLGSRAIRLTFIRYFGIGSYKLLNWETDAVYSDQNMCFDEGPANLIVGLQCVKWSKNENSLLPRMMKESVLAKKGDETSVVVNVADRLGVDIVTRDGNNRAGV